MQGSNQLENPTSTFDTFGFLADGAPPHLEATKTGFTFQNEGDNEPSGIHVSDGDPDAKALLGSDPPGHDAHAFFTQQHGENHVFEIVPQWDH